MAEFFYGEDEAQVAIDDLRVLAGRLPPRALGLVVEWAMLHGDDLRRAWSLAAVHQPIGTIEPLR